MAKAIVKDSNGKVFGIVKDVPPGWLKEGYHIIDASELPAGWQKDTSQKRVPVEVPTWKLRAVIALDGKKNAVDTAINSLPEPDKTVAILAWSQSPVIRRNSPLLEKLRLLLGYTSAQLDGFFISADALVV